MANSETRTFDVTTEQRCTSSRFYSVEATSVADARRIFKEARQRAGVLSYEQLEGPFECYGDALEPTGVEVVRKVVEQEAQDD